ncbi:MAG TPA: glycine--tRNA ligase subunit beta [Candidatus Sulfopaludibacter sp.]|jgi:glycyl-tRNA synthetase beta chain|nr:glycine--tRNA ligase subunit beta [Candidatus Sulfopaludibacter sp.]
MSLPLLLEIGTEEIPDWMIPNALESLRLQFEKLEIPYESVSLDATPRRLVLRAEGLPEKQGDSEKRTVGPSASAPPKALEGFARKQGLTPEQLTVENGYYVATKKVVGRKIKDILAESLPSIILAIYFPKTMYWTGKGGPRFIRPIRWIVALLGEEVVPFELAGVRSDALTSGHRRLGAREVVVTTQDYEQRLHDHYVILSAEARRKKICGEIAAMSVKNDAALLETLVYITEYPTAIQGSFDPQFLELPEEVLITVMRHHQKYFSVEDAGGKLAPRFVAVMNIDSDPEGFVRSGNERVLRARFNDARFFWETDQKKTLAGRRPDLEHVTFQAKLGSYLAKTERTMALVQELGGNSHAVRAAELLKCDLTTELVKEFTELQGVVGGLYARTQGEPAEVWQAIYDQYKPESMEDAIPRNRTAQLVALADKLDTLRGCFGVGLIPTGSRDPFALRRAAQGVVKTIVEGRLDVSLLDVIGKDPALVSFFEDRIKFYFKDVRGFKFDEVNAAMAAGWSSLVDLEERLGRIQNLRLTPDFEPLAASFKRIRNILEQAKFEGEGAVDPSLLEEGPEQELYREYQGIAGQPIESVIARLRPKVDLFFDKVLVNAPDARIRQNRLTLLKTLLAEFSTIADFSEIVTTS